MLWSKHEPIKKGYSFRFVKMYCFCLNLKRCCRSRLKISIQERNVVAFCTTMTTLSNFETLQQEQSSVVNPNYIMVWGNLSTCIMYVESLVKWAFLHSFVLECSSHEDTMHCGAIIVKCLSQGHKSVTTGTRTQALQRLSHNLSLMPLTLS